MHVTCFVTRLLNSHVGDESGDRLLTISSGGSSLLAEEGCWDELLTGSEGG